MSPKKEKYMYIEDSPSICFSMGLCSFFFNTAANIKANFRINKRNIVFIFNIKNEYSYFCKNNIYERKWKQLLMSELIKYVKITTEA